MWGIPLATSIVNIAGTAALLVLLRRRLGGIGFAEVAASFVRVLVAALVAGGIAFAVWWSLDSVTGRSLAGQLSSLLPALIAALLAYFAAGKLLRVREMQALLSLRSRPRRG